MGRLTRLIRRLAKPFAMFAVVGTVSLSLVLSSPTSAQAWALPPVAPPIISGAVKTAAPGLLMGAARFVPGIGWAMNLISLGTILYDSRESWLPYVTGTFGIGNPNNYPANPASGANLANSLTISNPTINGEYANINWTWTQDNPMGLAFNMAFTMTCKRANGTTVVAKSYAGGSADPRDLTGSSNARCVDPATGNGLPMVGFIAGAPGAHTELLPRTTSGNGSFPGPKNILHAGSMANPEGFDPRSPGTTYKVRSECIDSGGTKSFVEATSQGDAGAIKFPSCAAAGKGHGTGVMTVTGLRPGGAPAEEKTLWDIPTAPMDPSTPLCDPGTTSSGCTLEVTKDGQPCTTGDVECENWEEQSQKGDQNAQRYGCKFGPYMLPMSACALLARAYLPGGAPATDANTDGNPATNNNNDPNGQPIPTVAGPVTGTVPGSSGQPAPGADPDASKSRQCFPNGWAVFNPVEWVLKPIRCAFEPTKDLQTRVSSMQAQFSNRVPVSWFSNSISSPSGSSCPADWAVSFQGETYSLICGTQAESIIRGFRPVMGVMLTVAMLWPLLRSLFYSAIPVFKVTPS